MLVSLLRIIIILCPNHYHLLSRPISPPIHYVNLLLIPRRAYIIILAQYRSISHKHTHLNPSAYTHSPMIIIHDVVVLILVLSQLI